jgi:hypothetical protein
MGAARKEVGVTGVRILVYGVVLMAVAILASCDNREGHAPSPVSPRIVGPAWAVDPADPGPDLPPVGRSLFDFVVAESGLPFPFPKLVDEITRRTGQPPRRVLMPLNRSLQRHAAGGQPFGFPRAVLAVDGESLSDHSGPYLKDRLFIAYQENAGILEVISYNEAAGRFEFQVARDYRPGGQPKLFYANRILCTTCHQNQAPIFSRPLWRETNANPEIAAGLLATGRTFYGFPITQGVDVPNAMDDATDRANRLAVVQKIWRIGVPHRAELLKWALQYRLGRLRLDELVAPPDLAAAWQEEWPTGLAIPNPDIPDRDPLRYGSTQPQTFGITRTDLRAPFEPSLPREAGEVWQMQRDANLILRRVVGDLADFFSEADIRLLKEVDAAVLEAAIHRMADPGQQGHSDALSAQPFRRAAIMQALASELAMPPMARCCLEDAGLPPVRLDGFPHAVKWPDDANPALPLFERYCADCHHGSDLGSHPSHPSQDSHPSQSSQSSQDSFPPNFLHGAARKVEANVKQCAERIFFRLSMWNSPLPLEAPMPPFHALQRKGLSPAQWVGHDDLATLQQYVGQILESETGKSPKMRDLIERGYDNLRGCMPS